MSFKNLIPIFFTLLFISCSSDDFSEEKSELNQARQRWDNAQVQNYSIHEKLSCYCLGLLFEWDVFVVNDTKDKVTYDETNPSVEYADIFDQARTIEDTFDFIESLFNQNIDSLEIEYDVIYGFPKLIKIDYIKNVIDDEKMYSYTEFEITD